MCENSFLYLAVFKLKYVKGINLCLTLRSHQEIDCREEFQNIKLRRVPRRIHYNLIPAVILFTVHFKRGHQKVNFFPHFLPSSSQSRIKDSTHRDTFKPMAMHSFYLQAAEILPLLQQPVSGNQNPWSATSHAPSKTKF